MSEPKAAPVFGAGGGLGLRGDKGGAMEPYASKHLTPVSIQQMLQLPKSKTQVAPLLREELLIRVARRHRDMFDLPAGLLETEPVSRVIRLYHAFFRTLLELESPRNEEAHARFEAALRGFYTADGATLPSIALGMREWRQLRGDKLIQSGTNARLDDLFTARLSIRMLIAQHVEVPGKAKIVRGLAAAEVARSAFETTRAMCLRRFGVCPELRIEGHTDFKFTYVNTHLHHTLFELLKNSVRAVVEQHRGAQGEERRKRLALSRDGLGADKLPPVVVVISGGKEDVVIKVSDEGGGISRSDLAQRIWSYEYTTATDQDRRLNNPSGGVDVEKPFLTFRENFYGMGYGLPIARVFSRYLGGDLKIISTEGWGTDAYVYLNRLESASVETLPE